MRPHLAALLLLTLTLIAPPAAGAQPNRPQAGPVELDPLTTAVLVLDVSARCETPTQPCSRLAPPIGNALSTFRAAGVPVIYTVPLDAVGTAFGDVWSGFKPLGENEVVIYPDGLDKFRGGELDEILRDHGITTLVITGAPANLAVMYTATSAAEIYGYDVFIPLDGTVAASQYEYEYSIHQLTVLPAANRFRFTRLDLLSFGAR